MNKFMPPPMKFPTDLAIDEAYRVVDFMNDFNNWYDEHIKPLFENAVEVYAYKPENAHHGWSSLIDEDGGDTHKALLINIQPLKDESAEELLNDIVAKYDTDAYGMDLEKAIRKAKSFLNKENEK